MKFDLMSYLENYQILEFITGSQYGALWLCAGIGLVVWLVSYLLVGLIFQFIGFRGNSKPMSACYSIISSIVTGIFYGLLDTFKAPIAWVVEHWKLCLLLFIGFLVVINLLPLIEDMYYRYCDSKNK